MVFFGPLLFCCFFAFSALGHMLSAPRLTQRLLQKSQQAAFSVKKGAGMGGNVRVGLEAVKGVQVRLCAAEKGLYMSCVSKIALLKIPSRSTLFRHALHVNRLCCGRLALCRVPFPVSAARALAAWGLLFAHVQTLTPSFLSSPKTVSIIGAPMSYGQPFAGTDRGPAAVREKGLHQVRCTHVRFGLCLFVERSASKQRSCLSFSFSLLQALTKLGWRVEETGDLTFEPPSHSTAGLSVCFVVCLLPLPPSSRILAASMRGVRPAQHLRKEKRLLLLELCEAHGTEYTGPGNCRFSQAVGGACKKLCVCVCVCVCALVSAPLLTSPQPRATLC